MTRLERFENYDIFFEKDRFIAKATKQELTDIQPQENIGKLRELINEANKRLERDARLKEEEEETRTKLHAKLKDIKIETNANEFIGLLKKIRLFSSSCHFATPKTTELVCLQFDPANVALVRLRIPAKANLAEFKFELNADRILPLLSQKFGPDEKIWLTFEPDKAMIQTSRGTIEAASVILSDYTAKIPDLKFKYDCLVNLNDLTVAINTCKFAASIWLDSTEGLCIKSGKTDDDLAFRSNQLGKPGTEKSKYAVDYLVKLMKLFTTEKVRVQFNNDFPLKIRDDNGNFAILAPRVENE